jgi:hypothetical protein
MITKTIEVRDGVTFIPMLVIKLCPSNDADQYLFSKVGYGNSKDLCILLVNLDDTIANYDPHGWKDTTRQTVHLWLIKHFDKIESGAVIDIRFILRVTNESK